MWTYKNLLRLRLCGYDGVGFHEKCSLYLPVQLRAFCSASLSRSQIHNLVTIFICPHGLMRRGLCGMLLGIACTITVPVWAAVGDAQKILQELTAQHAPDYTPPHVVDVKLANGMRCFLLEDPLLPVFRFRLYFPAGDIYDPPDKIGLSEFMERALQTGGTTKHDAEWIDQFLDQHAMKVNVDVEWEYGDAHLQSLSASAREGLEILFEMLYAPAFESSRLTIIKNKMLEGIRRRNDSPEVISDRVFRKILYGRKNPWAETPTAHDIQQLTREDLQALHASLFAPSQMLCAAAGNFHASALVKSLEEIMAAYPERQPVAWTPPPVTPVAAPGIWLVPKAVPQSVVSVGQLGTSRDNPDKFALSVMNDVLGSPATFTSWLVQNIRTAHGLAYEAWSTMQFGPPHIPGLFYAHAKTRADATARTVELLHQNIRAMQAGDKVTPAEVNDMKEAMLKRFIFQYEDPFDLVTMMMRFVYFGFPANYLQIYHDGIATVTHADVVRVAKQYLQPDQMTTLVVGDPKILREPLAASGPITEFDLGKEDANP